jgi:rare lipoprotein A (peptidoglycan hydrolase)
MDSLGDGESLALHKTAPIGTILKITNPMNKSVTFAKVVGKFSDNQDTHDAIVVLSKSVATTIGLLDRRFQIELNYGAPLD